MKELNFLNKLRKENKLKLVEPSEEIKESYIEKANNCFKSARPLLQNTLFENSISMSYYVMYNSLTALLYKTGIKCENHTGSIILLKIIFKQDKLYNSILFAKEERIDKQYYVTIDSDFQLTEASTVEMLTKAEDFLTEIRTLIGNIKNDDVNIYRRNFEEIK